MKKLPQFFYACSNLRGGDITRNLTSNELDRYKNQLKGLAEKAKEDGTLEEYSASIMDIYMLASPVGKRIYESFSDDELKEILIGFYADNGRSPAQKEIFFVYKHYIRVRFGNWPWALQAAGLKEKKQSVARKRRGRHRSAREKAVNKLRKM